MKLTETQIAIVQPLIIEANEAKKKLETALVLIVGRDFANYSIKDGELSFEEIEKKK